MRPSSHGFYGKLPNRGDFVQRGLSPRFIGVWDPWLENLLRGAKEELAEAWPEVFLTGPVLRFITMDGVAGSSVWAGVLTPSQDRVERIFPLTLAAKWPSSISCLKLAESGGSWFSALEDLALEAIDDARSDPDSLLDAISNVQSPDSSVVAVVSDSEELGGLENNPAALTPSWGFQLERILRDENAQLSFWWWPGTTEIPGRWHVARGELDARTYCELIRLPKMHSGSGDVGGRADNDTQSRTRTTSIPDAEQSARFRSAAVSDTGHSRTENQDACLSSDEGGYWVVADGMGGHEDGAEASELVIDQVGDALGGVTTLHDKVDKARGAIRDANAILRERAAERGPDYLSGSTVVCVVADDDAAAVLWVGDSRAYRLTTSGELQTLTSDHAAPSTEGINVVTRAVGGAANLEVDVRTFRLQQGERLLLCTDGVHTAVPAEALQTLMHVALDPVSATAKIQRSVLNGRADDNLTAVVVWYD